MREHRVYFGKLISSHYFVEISKDLFREWDPKDIPNISHRDIVKQRLKERKDEFKIRLITLDCIKHGCKASVKLIKTVSRSKGVKISHEEWTKTFDGIMVHLGVKK